MRRLFLPLLILGAVLAVGLGTDASPGLANQPPSPEEVDRRYREFN